MRKALIVDDAAFMRFTICEMLERNQFLVAGMAEDGLEAYNQYKKTKPDIVMMDVAMPNTSGLDALSMILDYDPDARVVMVSVVGQETLVRQAIARGAKSYIIKPFKEEQLIRTLNRILEIK